MPPVAHPGCDCYAVTAPKPVHSESVRMQGKFQFGNPEVETHPPSAM